MHVAVVSMHTHHHEGTDAAERTGWLARGLADAGHDVTVLCARWWDGSVPAFERDGVDYRALVDGLARVGFAARLPVALLRVRPDVVHAVNSPPLHARVAEATGRLLRTPVVVDWWCDRESDSRSDYRNVAGGADRVVVPSRTVRTGVREHGAGDDRIRIVPEGIEMDLIREARIDERADVVFARDLDEHANVENFLLALAELRDRDWRAAVVGDGPRRAAAERTAADLRIDDRVEFVGDLPPEEFVPILKGAHVFAHTATRAPFATDLLWALACGCVGIVEYQAESSAHELVERHDRGRRVTSPRELADEIVAAADLPRRTVDETVAGYDRPEVVARLVDCYEGAIDGDGGRRG